MMTEPDKCAERGMIALINRWQAAVNAQDSSALLALTDPQVTIAGPRGTGQGLALLQAWLERSGITMRTVRCFARGDTVVLAQHGLWRDLTSGAVQGEVVFASIFRVAAGRVTHYARVDSLAEALAASGLSAADELTDPAIA